MRRWNPISTLNVQKVEYCPIHFVSFFLIKKKKHQKFISTMTEVEVESSPFIKSPSCVKFDSTFCVKPEEVGLSMVRCRAPKHSLNKSSNDISSLPSKSHRRRFTFSHSDALKGVDRYSRRMSKFWNFNVYLFVCLFLK